MLAITIGFMDTIMVSAVGESAVSGVSLVDMVNVLIINIFAALATGGSVVVAQLLGGKQRDKACSAAKQLFFIIILISTAVAALTLFLRRPILRLLFGTITDDVMASALTYFTISALSYPMLAVYNAGAALFRVQNNSQISMLIAGLINVLNVIGNYVFIFLLSMGVAGAALASLISRSAAAVVITMLLLNPEHTVSLRGGPKFHPDLGLIQRILQIGIPNGLENSLFQLGRVLVVSIIALFGTSQIAANAFANNLDAIACIPGQAINLALITVVGQCIGAGDQEQARRMVIKLMKITYIIMGVVCLFTLSICPLVTRLYNISPEALRLGVTLVRIHNGCAMFLWPLSFTLTNALRAANDVRFPMVVSISSMMLIRLLSGYVLAVHFNLGAVGIWIAMVGDWVCRAFCFTVRFLSGKWLRYAAGVRTAAVKS